MALFEKRTLVFQKQDKAAFRQAKDALKAGGITGIRSGDFENEPPVCGCGSKLDPRNFGANGKIDRSFYWIEVPDSQLEKAQQLLTPLGLNCIEEAIRKTSWI